MWDVNGARGLSKGREQWGGESHFPLTPTPRRSTSQCMARESAEIIYGARVEFIVYHKAMF